MRAVELVNVGIEATTGAPLVLLREHEAPNRLLPVFIGGVEASSIALALEDARPPRPGTHDLVVALVDDLGAQVDRVEIHDVEDGTFLAAIVVSSSTGEHRVDARPSDAIAVAVRTGAPVLVSEAVLEEAGATAPIAPDDEEAIDQAVDAFRDFLGGVEPADFDASPPAPGGQAADTAAVDAEPLEADDTATADVEPIEAAAVDAEVDEADDGAVDAEVAETDPTGAVDADVVDEEPTTDGGAGDDEGDARGR